MKKAIATALLSISPFITHAAEPTTILKDGQTISLIGHIKLDQSSGYLFEPKDFVAFSTDQSFQTELSIDQKNGLTQQNLDDLVNHEIKATCLIKKQEIGNSICVMSDAEIYNAPIVEPDWSKKQRAEDDAFAASTFDKATIGQTAFTSTSANQIGEVVPRRSLFMVFYQKLSCRLPINNAKNMRRAEILYGRKLVESCWGMTLSPLHDEFIYVTKFGSGGSGSLFSMRTVRISPDGSAIVTGDALSHSEYERRLQDYQKSIR
ncbi:hypothetical protein [Burkholderia glumae]|uniref:Uncharacterized protein n=1 Tax=Burkholderia glumae TaxID=337 RepID=A0ABY5BFI9_BURGL|nr:hypothetical protein [Burkholderia glumae]USS44607.1 hypothetical protein NFI99_23555 [Burkholderia glumae]